MRIFTHVKWSIKKISSLTSSKRLPKREQTTVIYNLSHKLLVIFNLYCSLYYYIKKQSDYGKYERIK